MNRGFRVGWALAAACLSLMSCSGPALKLAGADNKAAAQKLAAYLKGEKLAVVNTFPDSVVVKYENENVVLEPKMLPGGINRLVVKKIYAVRAKDEAAAAALKDLLWKINCNYNMAQFVLDTNRNLVIQSQMTFTEGVSREEIEKYLKFFNMSMVMVLKNNPAVMSYLN
jgi:hypothetical protein